MRVVLIEGPDANLGGRTAALRTRLEAGGHSVALVEVTAAELAAAELDRFAFRHRLRRRLRGAATLPHPWDLLAHGFRRRLEGLRGDLVLARGAVAAHVGFEAKRPLALDVDGVATLELAKRWHVDALDLQATAVRETAALARAAVVAVPHREVGQLLADAFPQIGGLGQRLVEAPNGLQSQDGPRVAREGLLIVATPVVHADDPLLQASLATRLTGRLRRLGEPGLAFEFLPAPPPALGPDETVSFGLVTSLSDRLSRVRCWRVNAMLELGIPVLAPRWVAIDPGLEHAVVRYEEGSFESALAAALEPAAFAQLAAAARTVRSLRAWQVTLAPLMERLETR